MADKKISQLDLVAQINNDAVIPMSQENGGEQTTYKAPITDIAAKIGEGTTFSNLATTAKNLVGAINEIEAGGGGGSSNANLAPDYDATSTYAVGDWCIYNGTLYQCNTAISTAEAFDSTHWTAKKVVDAFADIEDELDDKVDTSDFLATNLPIQSGSSTNTKDYIDTGLSGKVSTTDTPIQLANKYLSSACQWFTTNLGQNTNTMVISTTDNLPTNNAIHILLFGRYGAWVVRAGVDGTGYFSGVEVTKLESGSNTVTASVSGKSITLTGLGTWSTFLGVIVKDYYQTVTFTISQS